MSITVADMMKQQPGTSLEMTDDLKYKQCTTYQCFYSIIDTGYFFSHYKIIMFKISKSKKINGIPQITLVVVDKVQPSKKRPHKFEPQIEKEYETSMILDHDVNHNRIKITFQSVYNEQPLRLYFKHQHRLKKLWSILLNKMMAGDNVMNDPTYSSIRDCYQQKKSQSKNPRQSNHLYRHSNNFQLQIQKILNQEQGNNRQGLAIKLNTALRQVNKQDIDLRESRQNLEELKQQNETLQSQLKVETGWANLINLLPAEDIDFQVSEQYRVASGQQTNDS